MKKLFIAPLLSANFAPTALAERQSVQQAVVADYARRFEDYLAERGSHLSGLMTRTD